MSKLTKSEIEAIEAYVNAGSQNKAAKSLGISRRSFRNRYDKAQRKLHGTPAGFKTTKINTDGSGSVTSRQHKLAPEITDVKREGEIVRRSTLYGADGSVTAEWVIRKPEEETQADYIEALKKSFENDVVKLKVPNLHRNSKVSSDLSLLFSIDEHIGVRLVKEQVGVDYNLTDAVNLMLDRFDILLSRMPDTEEVLFVNLGDQFHANDHMDVTPASKHTLHSDSTFNVISDAVVHMNRVKISMLLDKYDKLTVRGVSGNHDVDPMGWLFRCISIAYENTDRVDSEFWSHGLGVHQHGNVMLGFAHGHKMKPDSMAGACADRFPKEYGSSSMRYLHTGHIHHDSSRDLWGGFKWYSHRTMSPKDAFSFTNGYLSRQSMKGYVINNKEGEISTAITTLI